MTNSATLTRSSRDAILGTTRRSAALGVTTRSASLTLTNPATPRQFLILQDGAFLLLQSGDKIIVGAV